MPENLIKKPELIAVTLDNNDVALFVNGDAVYQLDANDPGQDPDEMGGYLAKALGVELRSVNMAVPDDREWSWNDVYDTLKSGDAGASPGM